jgi:hypothetical protein
MSGNWITDRQVRRYMDRRRKGDSQPVAAARGGFSERTARRVDAGKALPSQPAPRHWRTRSDLLVGVWDEIIVPMLRETAHLRATTVIDEINHADPGRLDERHTRTFQRRLAHWRATEGPEREVISGRTILRASSPGAILPSGTRWKRSLEGSRSRICFSISGWPSRAGNMSKSSREARASRP